MERTSQLKQGVAQKVGRVLFLVEEKREALGREGADQWQALSLARFHLLRALNELILFKEDEILVPLLCEAQGERLRQARELKNRNLDLQLEYDAFIRRHVLQGPLGVSERYKSDAHAMMQHIETEVRSDLHRVQALLDQSPEAGMPAG